MPVIIGEVSVSSAPEPRHEPMSEPAPTGPDPGAAARDWHRAMLERSDRLRAD